MGDYDTRVGPLLAERAPGDGPRSTRAVEPITGAIVRNGNKRAWKDGSLNRTSS